MDSLFCPTLLTGKRREYNMETHLLFLYYERPFYGIQSPILLNILKEKHVL